MLLTEEKYYGNCKQINAFALWFLNRSLNECVVDVEVKSLNNTSTDNRPLDKKKTTQMLNFIASSGPHPLVAMDLVDGFLDTHFGKD